MESKRQHRDSGSLLLICLALSSVFGLSSSQLDPSTQKEIDDLIQNEMFTKGKTSAAGLAIVQDGQVLYTQGYGQRDIENSIVADSSSLFYIGSMSKVNINTFI
jgi:CubicO group peptidase (beta-lactamase class C family)